MSEKPIEFQLKDQEYIQLNNLLKFLDLVNSGGEAKIRIQNEEVIVDGKIELRVRNKLRKGAIIEFDGKFIHVI